MDDLMYVYAIGLIPAALLAFEVVTKRFDPFAPIWLFFVGYVHLYMMEALNLREWALGVRGIEIVREASFRAFLGTLCGFCSSTSPCRDGCLRSVFRSRRARGR